MKLAELIAIVLERTPDEQEKVVTAIRAQQQFLGVKPTSPQKVNPKADNESLLLDAILECLSDFGVGFVSRDLAKNSAAYTSFKKQLPGVNEWVKSQRMQRNERRMLFRLAARLLYKDLRGMGVPIGLRMMMTNVSTIPAVVDKEFPGYAGMGLLSSIVRGLDGEKVDSYASGEPDNNSLV